MRLAGAILVSAVAVLAVCAALATADNVEAREYFTVAELRSEIYTEFTGAPCVRLLNNDGVIGCGYGSSYVAGPLYYAPSEAEVAALIANEEADDEFAIVTTFQTFAATVDDLEASGKMAGLLIMDAATTQGLSGGRVRPTEGWSTETTTPGGTLVPWNVNGNGMAYRNYSYPIFGLNATETTVFAERARMNTEMLNTYPRYGVEFLSHMQAGQDSSNCLRRGECLPVGGLSVWSRIQVPGVDVDATKPVVLATAALDATAFFHDLAYGADNDVSGLVALMGAAHALSTIPAANLAQLPNQIIMAFFNGEAWGNLGSLRFAKDVASFVCEDPSDNGCSQPFQSSLAFQDIKMDNIVDIVDVRQVGASTTGRLWAHDNGLAGSDELAETVEGLSSAANNPQGIPVLRAPGSNGLPPSSAAAFLEYNELIPTVVVTDHSGAFVNKFYGSVFDDADNIDADAICRASTTLARTLYARAAGPGTVPADIVADCDEVQHLLSCLTTDYSCQKVQDLIGYTGFGAVSHYASVFRFSTATLVNKFVRVYMANITGVHTDAGACAINADCGGSGEACVGGLCVAAPTYFHDAYSLAFEWDYEEQGWSVVDTERNDAWTESFWGATGLKLYREDDPATDVAVLFLGFFILGLSLVIGYFARAYYIKHLKID